jgi:hypothetical protein
MAKSTYNLRRSRNGRLNKARREAQKLVSLLEAFEGERLGIDVQEFWQAVREHGQQIAQCIHEANAYNNVMVGDGWPDAVQYGLPNTVSTPTET